MLVILNSKIAIAIELFANCNLDIVSFIAEIDKMATKSYLSFDYYLFGTNLLSGTLEIIMLTFIIKC